jgi:hypothetical protein
MKESTNLKSLIRFLLEEKTEAALKDEEDDVFGKYLFGQERGLPTPSNPEPDTEAEKEFDYALNRHYHGSMNSLNSWVAKIAELEASGKYNDILSVPKHYKYAYRVMSNVPKSILERILGKEPNTKVTPGKMVYEPSGGTFYSDHPFQKSRKHYSWTVRPNALEEMRANWGKISSSWGSNKEPEYIVFLRAKIHGDGNKFLLNPDEETLRNLADEFAYQDEVISFGDVNCDSIWYAEMTKYKAYDSKTSLASFDLRAVRQMLGHNRELTHKKLDENLVNTALDVVGLIPGIGEAADLANAILYATKKEYLLAGLSLISAIPAIGDIVGKGGKLTLWAQKTFPKASKQLAKLGPDTIAAIKKLKSAIAQNKNTIKKLFDVIDKEAESNNSTAAKKLAPHLPKIWEAIDVFTKTADVSMGNNGIVEGFALEYSGPKKYVKKTADGKTIRYGAKGYRIAPGTSRGDAYCARSNGQMKKHPEAAKNPNSPLRLSRKKWKCSGDKSRRD